MNETLKMIEALKEALGDIRQNRKELRILKKGLSKKIKELKKVAKGYLGGLDD